MARQKTTALDWSPEDEERLAHDIRPTGNELVRIRTELLAIAEKHCGAMAVAECRLLLLWAELG